MCGLSPESAWDDEQTQNPWYWDEVENKEEQQ
jgi:hypothetical protein